MDIASLLIPLLLTAAALWALRKRIDVYDARRGGVAQPQQIGGYVGRHRRQRVGVPAGAGQDTPQQRAKQAGQALRHAAPLHDRHDPRPQTQCARHGQRQLHGGGGALHGGRSAWR
mgnify:CR=1 FL=1